MLLFNTEKQKPVSYYSSHMGMELLLQQTPPTGVLPS